MATISFKEFSQGKPVSVVANEGKALKEEAESGSPSLMSKLSERAKTFGGELSLKPSRDILNNAQPGENKDMVATESLLRGAQSPIRAIGAVGGAIGDVVGAGLEATGLDKPIAEALQPVVESDPVQKAMSAFKMLPQDTQDVLGAIVNTANIPLTATGAGAVKTGVQAGVKKAGEVAGKVATETASKVLPTSEGIMQRVARIPKGEQAKFERITGESVGSYLDKRGIYGEPDKIVEQLYNRFQQSKSTADQALETIQGTYRATPVRTALKELEGKVQRTSSPGAPDPELARVAELVAKEQSNGLTMSEINEVKRIYERRVRLDYLKTNVPEDVARATNVDSALRNWQMSQAEKSGLTNLAEINKETQATKQLMDALGKEQAGIAGNNALGLTDAILVAGGSPESIASLVTKKIFSDKGVQSYVAKKISKNPVKQGVPEAQFKEKLQLPSPNGTTKVQIEVPISLLSKSESAIEQELIKNFGKKYTPAEIYEMANRLKELPAPKEGQTKVQIEVPIKMTPTRDVDISKGFSKTSKTTTQLAQEKLPVSSPQSTPTTPKSKGIRGMMDIDQIIKAFTPSDKSEFTTLVDTLSKAKRMGITGYDKLGGATEKNFVGEYPAKVRSAAIDLIHLVEDYPNKTEIFNSIDDNVMNVIRDSGYDVSYLKTGMSSKIQPDTKGFILVEGKPQEVLAKKVDLGGGVDFFAHESKNGTITITEKNSGMSIGSGQSLQEAIDNSKYVIKEKAGGISKLKELLKTKENKEIINSYSNNPSELVPKKKVVSSLEQEAKKYKSAEEFVKAQGTPVYHGTNAKFDTFDKSKVNSVESFGDYSGTGFYFTTDKVKAERYAKQAVKFKGGSENIIESYLDMKNPLVIKTSADSKALRESFGGDEEYFMMKPQDIQDELIKRGYDSVDDQLYGQKVVFSTEQIRTKSKLDSIWNKSVK